MVSLFDTPPIQTEKRKVSAHFISHLDIFLIVFSASVVHQQVMLNLVSVLIYNILQDLYSFSRRATMLSDNVLIPRRLPDFTADQQSFILQLIAAGIPYKEICEAFIEAYPDFAENLPSKAISERLYDRIRKLKSAKSDQITELSKEHRDKNAPIRSKDAEYRFRMLDEMLHNTPDTEVIYSTPDGVEKKQCNRAIKLKIIELMERIEGTFDKDGYADGRPADWMPPMVSGELLGPPPEQADNMEKLNPPPDETDTTGT